MTLDERLQLLVERVFFIQENGGCRCRRGDAGTASLFPGVAREVPMNHLVRTRLSGTLPVAVVGCIAWAVVSGQTVSEDTALGVARVRRLLDRGTYRRASRRLRAWSRALTSRTGPPQSER